MKSGSKILFDCLVFSAAGAMFIAGCGDAGSPVPVQKPRLAGSVALVGRLAGETGQPLGERRLEDADGVFVELLSKDTVVDSARTAHGRYEFRDLDPGTYRTRTWVDVSQPATSADVAVSGTGTASADTLVLAPSGSLATYPNPGVDEGVGVEFTMQSAQAYEVEVRTLSGDLVWHYSQSAPAGFYHVHWPGHDTFEQEAPEGAYWVIVHLAEGAMYNLVFWPGHEVSAGNCGHIEANGLLVSHHEDVLVHCWRGERDGDLQVLSGGVSPDLAVTFLAADSTQFAVADTCPENHLDWAVEDTTVASLRLAEGKKWTIQIVGKLPGSTNVVLRGWHQEHIHFISPAIPIVVE